MSDLTETERAHLIAWFAAHPRGGYKPAVRSLGGDYARVTQDEARAIVTGDSELVDARWGGYGIDQDTLYAAVGDIVGDKEHKDRLKGIMFALNVLYGVSDKDRVEITGDSGGPLQIIVESAFPNAQEAPDGNDGRGAVPGEPETS